MTGLIPVTMKPRFIGFEGIKKYTFPEGLTLQEIATEIGPDLPVNFWTGDGVICVGDRPVPREYWSRVKPRSIPGREIAVTFHVVPGGSDKLPGILTTIAGVALTAAGVFFNQPWLISLGVGVTLSGVGMLLAPPPPQPKDPGESKSVQAGISGNPPAPFEWLPRVLGRMIYSPPFLIRPYTVYSRKSITVAGAVGLIGRHTVSNIRINGALASSMTNLTTQTRTGAPGDTALTIGNKWVWEESPRLRLSNFDLKTDSSARDELFDQTTPTNSYPQFQTFLTRSGDHVDKVVIRLLFAQGMVADVDNNERVAIPLRFEFRQRGSSTWILGPELHFYDDNKGNAELRQNVTFLWQADGSGLLASPNLNRLSYVGYRQAGSSSWQYLANSYFSNGSSRYAYHVARDDDGFTIYLNPATFPQGHYEFRVKRGLGYRQGLFDTSTYEYDGSTTNANFFDHVTSGGIDIVRVEQYKIRGDVQIEAFQSWNDDYPLQAALTAGVPLTLVAFEARDMEINSVAAQFESQAPIWSGGNWNTIAATRNPAALYRHVLLDNLNADPRDTAIVDSGSLADWYTFCATNGYECNAVISANEPEVLAMIASAGWAGMRSHDQWEVILERDTSALLITQLFTPLNSSNYSASKAFADLPHALNVEFADEADDNNLTTIIVYAFGFSAANATRFETLRMDGFTSEAKATARATNLLRILYNRQVERRIDVGIEALVSMRGDLVGLAHDLKTQHIWFGTILEVLTSGGLVTGIVINGKALLSQAAPPFGTAIRYMNQAVVMKPIIGSADSDTLMFSTPFAIPDDNVLRKGCLVSVGVINSEAVRCRITNIRYKDEFFATVSMVDEAPQIYTGGFAGAGSAAGFGIASGVSTSSGMTTGIATGLALAIGISESFSSFQTGVGSAEGVGDANAIGTYTGTFAAAGIGDGFGGANAEGASLGGIGAAIGSAEGIGAASGIGFDPVPSTVPVVKALLTNTADKAPGEYYEFTSVDIGVAHAKRIVIIPFLVGNTSPSEFTIAGVNAYFVGGPDSTGIAYAEVPSGTTATIRIGGFFTNATRFIGKVYVAYPDSAFPIDEGFDQQSGSTDAIASDIEIVNGGFVFAVGGQNTVAGSSFTGTWSGSNTPTEDVDQEIESASTFACWRMVSTQNLSTGDFTVSVGVSGTKKLYIGSWGASA